MLRILSLASLGLLAAVAPVRGQEMTSGEWQTRVLSRNGTVVLHWTHVYEGMDTVHKLDLLSERGDSSSLKIVGQPVFNADTTLVAFPYCADDGCMTEIRIVDLLGARELQPISVPEEGQIYVACTWHNGTLRVAVEHGFFSEEGAQTTVHDFTIPSGR